MAIARALSDPGRVRILLVLRRRELCVCQITELFGFDPSTMSKHLSILHHAGLIQSRKTGRWVHYRLPDDPVPPAIREALDWVKKFPGRTAGARTDTRHLDKILKMDVSEICRRQCCR